MFHSNMERIFFLEGKQKQFLHQVQEKLNSPSLHTLLQFGITTNYSALKNYYTERRCLPKNLFLELCELAKINPNEIEHQEKKSSWGQQKGGKISKRK